MVRRDCVRSLGDREVCADGARREADVLHVQTEAFSRYVPRGTCPGEVPDNKGL